MLCCVVLRFVVRRCAEVYCAALCGVVLRRAVVCYSECCCVLSGVVLRYVLVLRCDALCCVVLCYVVSRRGVCSSVVLYCCDGM